MKSNHELTVATVYKILHPANGGPIAKFRYCVDQKVYKTIPTSTLICKLKWVGSLY